MMKKNTTAALLTALSILTFSGCNKGERAVCGRLSLSVSIPSETKASLSGEELLESSVINIYKADFSGLVRHYSYTELPSEIFLAADSYRIDVLAGQAATLPSGASWEQKSYMGSKRVDLQEGASENILIEALVCNAVSQVCFDTSIEDNFSPGYTFTLSTAEDATLVYDHSRSGNEGYFIIAKEDAAFSWAFKGTLKDGTPVQSEGTVPGLQRGRLYKMTPTYTVTEGTLLFNLVVDYDVDSAHDVIVFDPVSTGLVASKPSEIWAGHVTVHADVDESEYSDPSEVAFEYSADGAVWERVNATRSSEGVYEGVLKGLSPQTEYSYRLVIGEEIIGEPMTLTTALAPQLPNSGFETTSNAESSKWVSFYDPSSSDESLRTKFWDSGSSASAGMMGANYAICYSDTDVPSGIGSTKSARLQSIYAVVKFAAGNIFTGEFAGLDGMNGKVNFGRPWTSRPTAVRLWYKYYGGKVDHAGGELKQGDYDQMSVQIALGTWSHTKYGGTRTSPVQVNTGDKSTFWDYSSLPETIAFGKLEERGNGSTSSWRQVTIPLEYSNTTTFPTHILISCASSKWGDYFAGCSSSKLYLDNIELVYE